MNTKTLYRKPHQPKSIKRIDYNRLNIPDVRTNFKESVAEKLNAMHQNNNTNSQEK